MLWEIELLYFVAMLASICNIAACCKDSCWNFFDGVRYYWGGHYQLYFSGTEFTLRHFIEGGFAYLDNIF